MARVWKLVVVQATTYELDFGKDVSDPEDAKDLFERGHFLNTPSAKGTDFQTIEYIRVEPKE